jgi:pimeloyl-ACP methyl ester carboxylesterase
VAQPATPTATIDLLIRFTATDGVPLEGKLSLPPTATGPVPVVFYLHGAGPRSYDHPVRYRAPNGEIRTSGYYDYYARALAREGIGFFRMSKRGCSIDSTGRPKVDRALFSGATPTVLLADYARGLDALRRRQEINPDRIVLYGSSEGTRLAPQLALRAPSGITGLVLTSYQPDNQRQTVVWQNTVGPWRNIRAMIPAASDSGLGRADYDAAVARSAGIGRQLPFAVIDRDSNGVMTPAELAVMTQPRLDAILRAVEQRNDEFLGQALLNLSSAYLLDGWEAEPTHAFLVKLDLPIGIFHGELDGTTRVEGVRETEAAFQAARKSNLTVRIYPGYNHDLGWTPSVAESGGSPPLEDSFRFAAALARSR